MSDNFKTGFEEYLISRIQDGIEQYREDNASYREMKQLNRALYLSIEELAESLSENDKKQFSDFFDSEFIVKAEEEMIIYNRGIRDCVNILKALGVL